LIEFYSLNPPQPSFEKEGVLLFLKMRSITSQGGRLRKKGIEIVEKRPYC